MTQETRHHPSGPLLLALALAATAGFVDAWVYRNVTPVFVANMSGNLIHMGMDVGGAEWSGVVAAVVALSGFLVGVAVSIAHLEAEVRAGRTPRPNRLLLSEAMLLTAIVVLLLGADTTSSPTIRGWSIVAVFTSSVAMGVQAAALRRVGRIAVATTYGTGSVVRIGEKLALAAQRADRVDDMRRRATVVVLTAVVFSYVAGAAVAVAAGSARALLLAPAVVLLVASLTLPAIDPDPASRSAHAIR